MKIKLLVILALFLGDTMNVYSQDSTRVPINFKSLKTAILNNSFKGLVKLPSANIEAEDIKSALETNSNPDPNCVVTPAPINLAGLTGGWRVFFHHMTLETAVKVGIVAMGDASTNIGKEVYVYEQMNYKDISNCQGVKATYGAGIRLTILAKKTEATANFSNLGAIAASAEFKLAEVSVSMGTIGLSGSKITSAIPSAGTYSVEKHVQYLQSIDVIKAAVNDLTTVVTPEIISLNIPVETDLEYFKATYATFALKRIAKGESFNVAKTKVRVPDELSAESIKWVYSGIVKSADDTKPSAIHILQAKEFLKNSDQ